MLKDNTEFRDRFARWKAGEQVYENGRPLPAYGGGKPRKWTPNQQTRSSISKYEGDAMVKDAIDPLTGKMAKKNASFESVADSFVNTFSPETWEKVKGNDALLQALYHYAYNIGPGKFKERTLPMVDAYYRGEATVRDIQNAMWAHGDKKLRGLANRRIAERAMVEKALSDQFPAASQVPYRNDDYNYYRANQLGYKPDETGHMPSRDEVTGMYLKSPTHPTIMKSVVQDLSEGYQPYYNKQDGRIYSQPMFDVKQWVEGQLFKGLPGYGDGKTPFRYTYAGKENKPIRITNDEMGRVFQGLEVTPTKTKVTPAPEVMNTPAPQKSAFNGNEIRAFTDWLPLTGELGAALDIENAVKNKQYLDAALMGSMFVLPPALVKTARPLIRKAVKPIKRIIKRPPYTYSSASSLHDGAYLFPEKAASKVADSYRTRTGVEKATFKTMYDSAINKNDFYEEVLSKPLQDYLDVGFTKEEAIRASELFKRHPEYAMYLQQRGYKNISKASDIFSQSVIDDFLKQQFTSLRGVHAKSKDDAIIYLTHGEKGRTMPGGDRLNTNGGVYTSNSTNVADRFKNPEVGTEDGYVGRVVYQHNIPRDIPIEEQLEQYRKMIFPAGEVHPLRGTSSYFKELKAAREGGAIALEDDYVGRATKGVPGQERAYLPTKKEAHPLLTVEALDYYPNQTNKNGRWGYNMDAGNSEGLFIPRQMNVYSDFIRTAKAFLQPVKERNQQLYKETYDKAKSLWDTQQKRRDAMVAKIEKTRKRIRKGLGVSIGLGGISVPGLAIHKQIKEEEGFLDSPEFKEFLSDPKHNEYLQLSDNSGPFKRSKYEALALKYKRKYLRRLHQSKQEHGQ